MVYATHAFITRVHMGGSTTTTAAAAAAAAHIIILYIYVLGVFVVLQTYILRYAYTCACICSTYVQYVKARVYSYAILHVYICIYERILCGSEARPQKTSQ